MMDAQRGFSRAIAVGIVLLFVVTSCAPAFPSMGQLSVSQAADKLSVGMEETLQAREPSPPAPLDTPHTFYDEVGRTYTKPSTYAQLVTWYQNLEANYSNYIQVFKANELYGTGTIPKTGGGSYDLYIVRVTNESRGLHKPEVFFSGGTHGNERIGVIGLYWTLDWLLRHAYHPEYNCPERPYLQWLLDNREIYIEISHNPDGFDRNVRGDYLSRDLNREADHDSTFGPFDSVNGQTLKAFFNSHLLRTATWYHAGARMLLYPWQDEHPSVTGVSPVSGKSYTHAPADFYYYDASGLQLGDYIGDYGGDLNKDDIGTSDALGMGGPGCLDSWAYGADYVKHAVEDPYVNDGPYAGAGVYAWDPEAAANGDPAQTSYGNDTIDRFGSEVRRLFLYQADLGQPSVHWDDAPAGDYIEVGTDEPVTLSWLVHGCLVVDHTQLQYGTDPDPVNHSTVTTVDRDEHAGDLYGGSYWDGASNGNVASTVYTEELTFDEPGDYYIVAKAMVDQRYADVLRPDYYGSESYLRLIQERTDASFSESLTGTDGLEQIDGELYWYSTVFHVRALGRGISWYNSSYPYRKEITIDHTKVQGDLTNFPVLIDITDSDLASKAQSTGDDIVFSDMFNNKLNHEIEYYNTGHLIAWVNVPSLSSTLDTVLYIYYGNLTISPQQNPAAVWDSNYMMVQHLKETSGTHFDSTSNDNDGTAKNGVVQGTTGKIDGADDFDGTNDYVEVPHDDTLSGFTVAMTASAWVRLDKLTTRQTILNKYETATNDRGWALDYLISPAGFGFTASSVGGSTNWIAYTYPYAASTGTWYYVTAVWESNQIPRMYINGIQVSTSTTGTIASIYQNPGTPLYIGRAYPLATPNPPGRYLDGIIDEAQVSNIARSQAWIITSYNNQANPGSFYTVSTEKGPIFISGPYPSDDAINVPITTSSLHFTIDHVQGKSMRYTVTTLPDVGSDDITGVTNGTYSMPISGLESCTPYTWQVNVTDGTNIVSAEYSFSTKCPIAWWDAAWNNRRLITIDHTKIAESLSNFPVLIDITNESLAIYAQTNGNDFVFTDGSGTVLNHEIEQYDSSTGHLVSWVNIPTLSSEVNTVILMYYGNPICGNQENPASVWDSNYMMVQHFSETSATHIDSTINDNDGTPNGGVIQGTSGKIDGADSFDGTDDAVTVTHDDTLAGFTVGMTASAWVKFDSNDVRRAIISKYGSALPEQRSWNFEYVYSLGDQYLQFTGCADGSATYSYWQADFVPALDSWYYITVGWEANKKPTFYANGEKIALTSTTGSNISVLFNNTQTPLYIGRTYNVAPPRFWDGMIDEVEISNINRSAVWIHTSYANQNDPNSFYIIDVDESLSPALKVYSESPSDGSTNVPFSLTQLSAKLYNPDFTAMTYSITTSPDIGSKSGTVGNGVILIPVSGLESLCEYHWTLSVDDGIHTLTKEYVFTTKANTPPSFSTPQPANGSGSIPLSLSFLSIVLSDVDDQLMSYTIETWPNIGGSSGTTSNGAITATISGLLETTLYHWYVNVTDGMSWTRAVYHFTTEAPWGNSSWLHRQCISIDSTKVAGSLSNFPVLMSFSSNTGLADNALDSGDDLVFTTYTGTPLNYQIEYFNGTTGQLAAWVNVPSLSSTVDTLLYLYYGNEAAVNQENPSDVWDSHYMMVQHLNETPANTVIGHFDSTVNNNDGTPYTFGTGGHSTTNAVGIIDGADRFDGVSDYIQVADANSLGGYTIGMTISAWIKLDAITGRQTLICKHAASAGERGYVFEYNGTSSRLQFIGSADGTAYSTWDTVMFSPVAGQWYYVAVVWTANNYPTFYVNGQIIALLAQATPISQIRNNAQPLFIGKSYTTGRFTDGTIDEVQISDIGRTEVWITTSYNNQNSPSTFYALGSEETTPGTQYTISVKPSWNLISLPFNQAKDKASISVRYSGTVYSWATAVSNGYVLDHFYQWSPSTGYSIVDGLTPGLGVWMWSYQDCDLLVTSAAPDVDQLSSLGAGWNLVGLATDDVLAKTAVYVSCDGEVFTWDQASSGGDPIILGFVYGWHRLDQRYVLSGVFDPGSGYWVYAYKACVLKKTAS